MTPMKMPAPALRQPRPRRPPAWPSPPAPAAPFTPPAQPAPAPPPAPAAREMWVAASGVEPELALDPRDPALLESLSRVAAVRAPDEAQLAPSRGDLASARGYDREDLHAIADMARSYLFGGAPHLALVLFEGLHAVAPAEPYFALGLGLTYDRLDRAADAARSYAQAARLAPADARPLVNLAELRIEAGDRSAARALLGSAVLKAERAADRALAAKAAALLSQLGAA